MLHRKLFRASLFSCTILLYPFIHPQDAKRDTGAPIPGAQYVGDIKGGIGSTSISTTPNMPKGPNKSPQYSSSSAPSTERPSSNASGIFGLISNFFRPSKKELARDEVIRETDRILWKAASKIPLTHEEQVFMGSASNPPKVSVSAVTPAPAPVAAPVPTPAPVATTPPTPAIAYNINGIKKTICMPQYPNDMDTSLYNPMSNPQMMSSGASQQPSIIDKPNFPSLDGWKNPPSIGGGIPIPSNNESNGSDGGDLAKSLGGAMTAGGAYMLSQTAAPTAVTVTTTTGGGAAASTAIVAGEGFLAGTLLPIAIGVGGVVLIGGSIGFGLGALHDYIFNPGIGWCPTPAQRQAYHAARAAAKQAKVQVNSSSSSSTTGGNNNNGKDKKGGTAVGCVKERKVNEIPRTEVMRKIKENYRYDKQTKLHTLKENGTPIKCTRTGKDVHNIKWDGAHGDIEALNKRLTHMGSLDPETFEMYKGPVIGRVEKI